MPMQMPNSNTNARINAIAIMNMVARVGMNSDMREGEFDRVNSGATVSSGGFFALH